MNNQSLIYPSTESKAHRLQAGIDEYKARKAEQLYSRRRYRMRRVQDSHYALWVGILDASKEMHFHPVRLSLTHLRQFVAPFEVKKKSTIFKELAELQAAGIIDYYLESIDRETWVFKIQF